MCGIIALLRGPGTRIVLPASDVLDRLDRISRGVSDGGEVAAVAEAGALGLEELDRLGVGEVVLLGGTAALSEAVADAIAARVAEVRRIAGADSCHRRAPRR